LWIGCGSASLHGRTSLVFEQRGAATVLTASHWELPIQVQRAIRTEDGGALVTLLTPAAGLFGGDEARIDVECGPGTNVTICQVGATQLHKGDGHPIVCEVEVRVAADARFRYQPRELIPFVDANYRQRVRLHLQHGALAEIVEVVTPGRPETRFQYRRVDLQTEVLLDGTLVVLDAVRIEPALSDCTLLLGGFTHFGALLLLGPSLDRQDADALHACIAEEQAVCGSASLLPAYGIGVRALGHSAETLLGTLRRASSSGVTRIADSTASKVSFSR